MRIGGEVPDTASSQSDSWRWHPAVSLAPPCNGRSFPRTVSESCEDGCKLTLSYLSMMIHIPGNNEEDRCTLLATTKKPENNYNDNLISSAYSTFSLAHRSAKRAISLNDSNSFETRCRTPTTPKHIAVGRDIQNQSMTEKTKQKSQMHLYHRRVARRPFMFRASPEVRFQHSVQGVSLHCHAVGALLFAFQFMGSIFLHHKIMVRWRRDT